MALHVVISPSNSERVGALLSERFRDDHYQITGGTWVVSTRGLTTRQVSDRLEITSDDSVGPNAPGVVFGVKPSYWGNYNVGLWEWLKVKLEAADA